MPKALIATVGGTAAPLVKTIVEHRPAFVCFLCSQDSVEKIAEIKAGVRAEIGVEAAPFQDFKVIVEDINDLVGCYQKAQECVRRIAQWDAPPEETVVDYTGGTKTMSVALGLATIANGFLFSYVGGAKRTKEGLGIVVDGTEQVRTGVSPWTLFAIEERRRIAMFFNRYQFLAALEATRALLNRSELDGHLRAYLAIIEKLCIGYSAWDRFQHKEAADKLDEARKNLEAYVTLGGRTDSARLLDDVRANLEWLRKWQGETSGFRKQSRRQVIDLISNAARRAEEGKYDDAVARLYRALEMEGQISLAEPPLKIESSGDVPAERIPETLRDEYARKHTDEQDGKIKLGLYSVFNLLAEAGYRQGLAFREHEERLRGILSARNSSILAHGQTPITQETYQKLDALLRETLGISERVEFASMPTE